MKKYIKLLPFIIVILFVVLIKILSNNSFYHGCEYRSMEIEKAAFCGIVSHKLIDKSDHMLKKISILNNHTKDSINVIIEGDTSGLYNFINVGDSIYKEKNSMETTIVRDSIKKVFFIDFGCEKIKR